MITQARLQEITKIATEYAINAALELQKESSVNVHPDDLRVQTPQNKVRTLAKSYQTSKELAETSRDVKVRTLRLRREHVGTMALVIDRHGNAYKGRLAWSSGQWFLVAGGRQFCNFHQTNKTSVTHTHKGLVIRT